MLLDVCGGWLGWYRGEVGWELGGGGGGGAEVDECTVLWWKVGWWCWHG